MKLKKPPWYQAGGVVQFLVPTPHGFKFQASKS
jgi:hypothetical protein